MDDEECLQRYGTPLEPLEKDVVPAKKPVAIEDQIVKDENGKRRFHGAFTGGFSAGFWNTVGSLEGWTPQSFKSSRAERAQQRSQQRPEDFMDQEDLGEFGIAPQGIRTREEFAKDGEGESATGSRKRKLMQPNSVGPIPGVPVLEQLLKPVRDKVAVRILKSMGWKPGQGVGPRQTRKEKKQAKARNTREQYLLQHYGCGEEDGLRVGIANNASDEQNDVDDDEDDEEEEELTFAPDDYEPLFYNVKDNRFGLSYSGLSRAPVLSKGEGTAITLPSQHINLFGPLEVMDKSKKLSIRGQAFGVGALEEEDEDIYAKDDLTRYDFSLGGSNKPTQKKLKHVQDRSVIEGFAEDKTSVAYHEPFTIDLPRDFKPRNWALRRSRFAPLEPTRAKQFETDNEYKRAGLGRHDLNPEKRAKLLGEEVPPTNEKKVEEPKKTPNAAADRTKALLERISATSNNFTRGGLITAEGEEKPASETAKQKEETSEEMENTKLLDLAAAKTKHLDTAGGFKPFLGDDAKQARYEKFLASNLKQESEISQFLDGLQPVTLSAWDREMEMKEFIQARNIYKPLGGIMFDRFVTESAVQSVEEEKQKTLEGEKKIVMERTKCMWKPCALLCKRYNIADPFGGALQEPDKVMASKPKLSIFDYLEASINTKANFQTPVIIPKHVEHAKPKAAIITPTATSTMAAAAAESEPPPPGTSNDDIETPVTNEAPTATPAKSTKFVPKTELEQRVEESRNKPISEKTDLFKSIFDDSDDEEKETQNVDTTTTTDSKTEAEERRAAMRAQLGLPPIVPIQSTTNAAAANVLRNDSPPRGIFASLFKPPAVIEQKETIVAQAIIKDSKQDIPKQTNAAVPKIAFKSRAERQKSEQDPTENVEEPPPDVYGPKIPDRIQPTTSAKTTSKNSVSKDEHDIDAKLLQLWRLKKTEDILTPSSKKSKKSVQEEWIEKRLPSSDDSDSDSTATSSSSSSEDEVKQLKKKKKSIKKSKKRKSSVDKKSKKGKKSKLREKKHKSEKKKKKKSKK